MKKRKEQTSAEVVAVIRARHHQDLVVHSSYSYPEGNPNGNPNTGEMYTEWGFVDCEIPLIAVLTTWEIRPEKERRHERYREENIYWIFSAKEGCQ